MEYSALSSWSLRTMTRLGRFVRHRQVTSGVNAIISRRSVDPYGWYRSCLDLQSAAMRVSALVVFMAIVSSTHATAQRGDADNAGFTEDLTKRSPELVGNQWGWELTRYWNFAGWYKIGGRVLIMLATDLNLTDNVLWDPLTGLGRHFDHDQWVQFTEAHRQDRSLGLLSTGQGLDLPANRTAIVQAAPGAGMPSCSPNFSQYFNVYNSSHDILRSFYVVSKIADPLSVRYRICIEGSRDSIDTKPDITIKFDTQGNLTFIDALPDGTLLFLNLHLMSRSRNEATIVRLDNDLQQYTSVGGRMFILDAAGINAEIESLPHVQDPTARYRIFLAAIEAKKNAGLH
jgi:hypothetical protein